MNELKKLITVKSLTTLALTLVFVIMLLLGRDIPQEFVLVYNTVIAFYYGTQAEKQIQKLEKTQWV